MGIGSPDPPQFIYDDDDYKDVFIAGIPKADPCARHDHHRQDHDLARDHLVNFCRGPIPHESKR